MYLRRANRGLNLTISGRYLIGLTLVIGALAVITGVNGMFLFLGITLGLFSVSGVLSEKTVKLMQMAPDARLKILSASKNEVLSIKINSQSRQQDLFGLEFDLALDAPKAGLWRLKFNSISHSQLLKLPVKIEPLIYFKLSNLKRGYYNKVYLRAETRFPFGIFCKYKLLEASSQICVVPELRQDMLEYWRKFCEQVATKIPEGDEFLRHDPYYPRDSAKLIDWKKSAGRPKKHWVVVKRQQRHTSNDLCLTVDFGYTSDLQADVFERLLANFRTAFDALSESFPGLQVRMPSYTGGAKEQVYQALSQARSHDFNLKQTKAALDKNTNVTLITVYENHGKVGLA